MTVAAMLLLLLVFGHISVWRSVDMEISLLLYAAILPLLLLMKVPILELTLRPTRAHISDRVALFYAIGLLPVVYFTFGLANVALRLFLFGSEAPEFPYSIMAYGQLFGPNWYEFGWPDMFAAFIIAVILDTLLLRLFPLQVRRFKRILVVSVVGNVFVYGAAIAIFLYGFRQPLFS